MKVWTSSDTFFHLLDVDSEVHTVLATDVCHSRRMAVVPTAVHAALDVFVSIPTQGIPCTGLYISYCGLYYASYPSLATVCKQCTLVSVHVHLSMLLGVLKVEYRLCYQPE